jgi:hypothetical protein
MSAVRRSSGSGSAAVRGWWNSTGGRAAFEAALGFVAEVRMRQ